jgi:hypothetical protein
MEDTLFERGAAFLPTFLPGETLYSWCCRYHRLSGNGYAADTSLQLFGSQTAGLLHDFPSHLATFVERTHNECGDVKALAYSHTLFGFYAIFLTDEIAEQLIVNMAGESVDRLKFRLGLPASRLGAGHPLKACRTCVQEDVANAGIAYWHLAHQLPGILVCRKHGEVLMESSVKTKTVRRLQWVLPEDVEADQWCASVKIPAKVALTLEKIARFANALEAIPDSHLDQAILRHTYLAATKRHGWLTQAGFIRISALREAFTTYAHGLDAVPRLSICEFSI